MSIASKQQNEHLTRYVAEFICSTRLADLPPDVVALGKKSILDGLGLALSGGRHPAASWCAGTSRDLHLGAGPATVIGSSLKVAPRFAAFANGVGIHADDYDDTQLAVATDRVYGLLTHPTAPALPAALAMAEATKASGARRDAGLPPRRRGRVQDRRGDQPAPLPDRLPLHRHLRHLRRRRRQRQAARASTPKQTARALSHRRQPVGRPARELRHHDQAVPRRPLLRERRRRRAVRLATAGPPPTASSKPRAASSAPPAAATTPTRSPASSARRGPSPSPASRSSRIRRARSPIPA